MPNLNKDENAFFHKKFYYYIRDRKLKQKEGQQTRGNHSLKRRNSLNSQPRILLALPEIVNLK